MSVIYKPQTRKGPVILLSEDISSPPTITLQDGTVVSAVRADRAGGVYHGDNGFQWVFPNDVLGQQGAVLNVGGKTQTLGNTNMSYRGGAVGSLSESSKGSLGSTETGPGGSGPFGRTTPGSVGQFGVTPSFIGDLFPDPALIEGGAASYQYIDPIRFGEEFSSFQRNQLTENFAQSQGFALGALDSELSGLLNYAPKSAALKRSETAADNTFNQGQRTAQVNAAIPGVVSDLEQQASDARAYARGEVPDSVVDHALELGTRSAAADFASSSGFGVGSSAARKVSDLMSAEKRIQLSQFGNGLLSNNAAARAQLFLAPTEYSNAGTQINVAPSLSGSQLQQANFGAINQAVNVTAENAFSNVTNQSQFVTGLDQRTQEFNAGNINNFGLSKFNYLNSYVNSVAGAYQTDINTQVSLGQQNQAQTIAANQANQTAQADFLGNIIKAAIIAAGAA